MRFYLQSRLLLIKLFYSTHFRLDKKIINSPFKEGGRVWSVHRLEAIESRERKQNKKSAQNCSSFTEIIAFVVQLN